MIPRIFIYITLILIAAALLPPAITAYMRTSKKPQPRIHFIQDMDNQGKFRTQHENPLFDDNRAMRPPVDGAVMRGEIVDSEHLTSGTLNGTWATSFPSQITVNREFLQRGRERFDIYCQSCHGLAGYGDGIVDQVARDLLVNSRLGKGTSWVPPRNLHELTIHQQVVGEIFNTISVGKNNMPALESQITVEDRWAIVAWVRALQRSQNAELTDIPESDRDNLETVNLIPSNNEEEEADEE